MEPYWAGKPQAGNTDYCVCRQAECEDSCPTLRTVSFHDIL